MSTLRLLHRWTGGLIGLFLALLGLSGALLIHKDAYLRATLPHATDAQVQDVHAVAAAVDRIMADPKDRPRSILLASKDFGLHRLSYGKDEGGAYTDQTGAIVTRWSSKWERPELWIFDFHHYLFAGDPGKYTAGALGLAGLTFVITGLILWWPTRRMFSFRLWPKDMRQASVVQQHRNLGVLISPLLITSMLTGAMMNLSAVEEFLLAPITSAKEMKAAQASPKTKGGLLAEDLDWAALLQSARTRYPDAEFRTIGLPAKPGGLISLRLRQQAEWLPNGRTSFWFDPATGKVIDQRDAQALPMGVRIANLEFPIHAAKVGGLPYRLVMTTSGLSLALLGSLSVWSFWVNPKSKARKRPRTAEAQPKAA